MHLWSVLCVVFFFQAEDGIRDLVRSRGLGDVYKRQVVGLVYYAFAVIEGMIMRLYEIKPIEAIGNEQFLSLIHI